MAIATPKITDAIVPFLVLAIINADPPKKAIKTSLISGLTRPNSSEFYSIKGNKAKNK